MNRSALFLLCFASALTLAAPLQGSPAAQAAHTREDLYTRALAMLYTGGVAADYAEVAKLLRQAADLGLPAAQRSLAELYLNGVGVPKDASEAAKWFERAAVAGDVWAQSSLGYLYAEGLGVAKDEKRAVAWLERAAAAEDASGQFHLASLYARGFGVTRNPELALEGYRKAADQGFALAQFALATAYELGFGGREMSLDQAAYWYAKAAASGLEAARAPLKVLLPQIASLSSAPSTSAPQPQRAPLDVADVAGANLIESQQPVYPRAARAAGVQGAVIMQAVINRLGRVRSLRLVRGEPLLNEAAMDAVRRWVYKPQLVDGQPVEVITTITVNFSLQ